MGGVQVAKATYSSRIYCKLGLRKRAAACACTMALQPLSPPISEACCMRQPDTAHLACAWGSTTAAWAAGVLRCNRRRVGTHDVSWAWQRQGRDGVLGLQDVAYTGIQDDHDPKTWLGRLPGPLRRERVCFRFGSSNDGASAGQPRAD
jgi:hypothetical protein